jgi:molybdopterin-guanine dinucleotide biosynthesis protein A
MGVDKALLEWRGGPLLGFVVRVLEEALAPAGDLSPGTPLVVVRAPGQRLPPLGSGIEVVTDEVAGRGPLQGLRDGILVLQEHVDAAFVAPVDAPHLVPAFVRRVLEGLDGDTDAAVPHVRGHRERLLAGYRTTLAPVLDDLLASGERSVAALLGACRVKLLDESWLLEDGALAAADPGLRSVDDLDTPEQYEAVRRG